MRTLFVYKLATMKTLGSLHDFQTRNDTTSLCKVLYFYQNSVGIEVFHLSSDNQQFTTSNLIEIFIFSKNT